MLLTHYGCESCAMSLLPPQAGRPSFRRRGEDLSLPGKTKFHDELKKPLSSKICIVHRMLNDTFINRSKPIGWRELPLLDIDIEQKILIYRHMNIDCRSCQSFSFRTCCVTTFGFTIILFPRSLEDPLVFALKCFRVRRREDRKLLGLNGGLVLLRRWIPAALRKPWLSFRDLIIRKR